MTPRLLVLAAAATAFQLPGSFTRESVKVYRGGDFPVYQNPTSMRDELKAWAPDDTSDAMAEKAPTRPAPAPVARPAAPARRPAPAPVCLLYTSPSPRDRQKSRMPSSA